MSITLSSDPHLLKKCILEVLRRYDITFAISTGTPGPFRKITAMIMDSGGNVLGFAKIGEAPLAIQRIKNEAKILRWIKDQGLWDKDYEVNGKDYGIRIKVPELMYEGELGNAYMLIQTPTPFNGKSGRKYFDEEYANILRTLIDNTQINRKYSESEFYKNLKESIDNYSLSYKDVLQNGLWYLEDALGDKELCFALSHGDFAPWNMVWKGKEVFIYDWESACFEAPAGIDLMHFLFQTGFLLKKLRGKRLLEFCIDETPSRLLSDGIERPFIDSKFLLLSYLLRMASDEDKEQLLSPSAVERRNLIKLFTA